MTDRPAAPPDLTAQLQAPDGERAAAAAAVYGQLQGQLHRIARARLGQAAVDGDSALGATALVNEAFLRMFGGPLPAFENTEHFLAYAARTMRSVVVDMARARLAARRGGGAHHTQLGTTLGERLAAPDDEVLDVDAALTTLQQRQPRLAQVVELRYFAGLSDAEIAAMLGVTERTVQRDWVKARLLLAQALRPGGPGAGGS